MSKTFDKALESVTPEVKKIVDAQMKSIDQYQKEAEELYPYAKGKTLDWSDTFVDSLRAAYIAGRTKSEQEIATPEWIVNNYGELGVKVGGRFFFMYKGQSLEYKEMSGPMFYREVRKREFGECCHPLDFWTTAGHMKYTDFKASAPDEDWHPLPPKP